MSRLARTSRSLCCGASSLAVLIAVGAKSSRALGLPGEGGPRVYGGIDLLRAVALGESLDVGRNIVVIGGGNVAYDVARAVLRQTAYDTARTAARLPDTANVWLASPVVTTHVPPINSFAGFGST